MQAKQSASMSLGPDDLREVDERLLEYLTDGRITPVYAREEMVAEGFRDEITSTYLQQRLKRMSEHGHVRNLREVGLYELVGDPRQEADNNDT